MRGGRRIVGDVGLIACAYLQGFSQVAAGALERMKGCARRLGPVRISNMRSNDVSVPVIRAVRPMREGPRDAIDRLRSHDHIESIVRLRAAVRAMGQVDVSGWDENSLVEHLDEISATLCAIDAQLTRMADAVRARGFRIDEPLAA